MLRRQLSTQPLSIIALLFNVLKSYCIIFPGALGLVIISSLVHLILPPLFLRNSTFAGIAAIAFVFLIWFLFSAILKKANTRLLGGYMSTKEALRIAKHRYLRVLGSNIVFLSMGLFILLIIFSLNLIFNLVHLHPVFLMLSVTISTIIFVYVYFSVPEIVLHKISILKGFENSVRLVRRHWWRTFIILAFLGFAILGCEALGILFTGQHRLFLFTGYQFLLQVIFYPLLISTTLVLLNDLKLRQS